MTFEYRPRRHGDAEPRQRTVEDVQAGTTSTWRSSAPGCSTRLVSTGFQALLAPMLVDSHELQGAVFEQGHRPDARTGVEQLDVVGIAVLPGAMRKVLGIDHPFVSPTDFEDEVVGVTQSSVADQTMVALGATTLDIGGGAPLVGVDALEQQFESIVGNSYTEVADYVTANINLWPRPLVIVINAERFESLSAEQQTALLDAAQAAIPVSLDAARSEDLDGAAVICGTDMTMAVATDDELAAMHAALEPVYADLVSDPVTDGYFEAITALKEEIAAPPDGAECEPAVPDRSGFPQGTFQNQTNRLELADGLSR